MRILVSGFTAFGGFAVNPAEAIARGVAERVGGEFRAVEVSYAAARELVAEVAGDPPGVWVMVGVAGGATQVRLERMARNRVGRGADVRGVGLEGEIEPGAPDLPSTLFGGGDVAAPVGCVWSEDAGDYLCNYLYWLGLRRLPGTRVGFVHVTPGEVMPIGRQVEIVAAALGYSSTVYL